MEENKIILELSRITSKPSTPYKRSITISTYNSIDNVENYRNHNYDDNPDYAESDDLDIPLKLIEHNIKQLFQGEISVEVKYADY